MTGFFRSALLRLAVVLGLWPMPLLAEDAADITSLPTLRAPGTLTATAMARDAAWLEVDQPGLYRLMMEGPGLLGLTGFRTANGRSDASDPQVRLRADGSAYRPGVLDNLLLLPGHAYLIQTGVLAPRAVTLEMVQPIDPVQALTGEAMPGQSDDAPLQLVPGLAVLLQPDGVASLAVSGDPGLPVKLQVIAPPEALAGSSYQGVDLGNGGIYPLLVAAGARLQIKGEAGLDGQLPVQMLMVSAAAVDRIDEREPDDTDLGIWPDTGRQARGVLLADFDSDGYEMALDHAAVVDLTLQVADRGAATVTLSRHDADRWLQLVQVAAEDGVVLRSGLTLPAGLYRIVVAGERPLPSDYVVSVMPAETTAAGEPDDQPELARPLQPDTALRGQLGADNPAYIKFDITQAGHLWELRGVQGLTRLSIVDGNDRDVGSWDATGGALVLRLALPTGHYLAFLRGDGPYALRLADLGQRPEGYEGEPNDDDATAMRLVPGQHDTGDFQTAGDNDLYEINLAAPQPLTLTLTAPDDGAMKADLALDGVGTLQTVVAPQGGPVSYTALFPLGRSVLRLSARDDGLSGRYQVALSRAGFAEDNEPVGVAALPRDGRISGRVGGFDAEDRVFVPVPMGSGTLAVTCRGAAEMALYSYGDETVLARAAPGEVILQDYTPDLGGAVELRLAGADVPADYACRVVFPPEVGPLDPVRHDEALDEGAVTVVHPGQRVVGQTADAGDYDRFRIAAEGALVGLRCDAAVDRWRVFEGDHLAQSLSAAMPDGTHVFVADASDVLEIGPGPDGPAGWACEVIAEDAFLPPSRLGEPAPFIGQGTMPVLSSLALGRPDWLQPTQVTNDLDIGMVVAGLETPFRAYARQGQQADLRLALRNPGPARTVALEIAVLADGWRVTPAAVSVAVAAGGSVDVPLTLELPPMQSGISDPQLHVVAMTAGQRAAVTLPVMLVPTAAIRGGHAFWSAPPGLRGGLDPLRYQLGARLIALDGVPVDEAAAADWAFLHDGDAPDSDLLHWLDAMAAEFRLAEPAPVVGIVVQLRSAKDRSDWPDRLSLDLSMDGLSWTEAATVDLSASALPQIFALAGPVQAGFARIRRHGCRGDAGCSGVALADVGLVAAPDWRFAQPLDIADKALGGHVVTAQSLGGEQQAESPFGRSWNDDLLTEYRPDAMDPASTERGDRIEAVIAFQSDRAARIAAVEWVGNAEDGLRLDGAAVQISMNGPAGLWTDVGTLHSPAVGLLSARLDLPTPVWARAVKLIFRRDAAEQRFVPDRVRIWEDKTGPQLLGLWEGDSSVAGYEATVDRRLADPVATGGADAGQAVALTPDNAVTSSVLLERNEDWWRITVPSGPQQALTLTFKDAALPEFVADLTGSDGDVLPLARKVDEAGDLVLSAVVQPGPYLLRISEPPRSVAILWDTSDSVGPYIPRILDAVRLWATSLKPGRDRIQLLPFGTDTLLLDDWAGTAEAVYPALAALPASNSSDAETAMGVAAAALAGVDGQRGIVVITDAETAQSANVWQPLLRANPRVVALSIDSSDPAGVHILQDWASLNGGYFTRVSGSTGLADGLDLAAALFRAPKAYHLTASLAVLHEPEGTGELFIQGVKTDTQPTGGIEVILDASGSMLKRMEDGKRRIEVAHDALSGLVRETLPAGTPFAFRAFGLAKDDCASELKLPFGPLDPKAAEQAIRAVPAVNLAKTAIAASLAAAAADLAEVSPPRVVVLVTDGDETCDGDVAAEIARIRAQGLDIRLSIVGFAVDDAALSQTFAAWTRESGARFVPAGDAAALKAAMREATLPRFAADRQYLDGRVDEVASFGVETTVTLPAGRYRLRPLQTAVGAALEVDINDGQSLDLRYDGKTGLTAK
ncbi:MAG: hypothetical protein ABI832_04150 [bacterium]